MLLWYCEFTQEGTPGFLALFRYCSEVKKQDWKGQVFQIKHGFFKYFKSNVVRSIIIIDN